MTNVLVCIKRVPDSSGQILLTDDAQGIDGRYVGFTVSDHENSAIELAIRVADATGGTVTLVTVGPSEAVEQLRSTLALGGHAAVLVEADPAAIGPVDVAREIAQVVADHEAAGTTYDLVLLGNDAVDSGDFQVPIRLAYALGRPIVTGASLVEVADETLVAHVDGPDGEETYTAKKVEIETRSTTGELVGAHRVRLLLPPAESSSVEVLGEGPDAATAVVDLLERLAVVR